MEVSATEPVVKDTNDTTDEQFQGDPVVLLSEQLIKHSSDPDDTSPEQKMTTQPIDEAVSSGSGSDMKVSTGRNAQMEPADVPGYETGTQVNGDSVSRFGVKFDEDLESTAVETSNSLVNTSDGGVKLSENVSSQNGLVNEGTIPITPLCQSELKEISASDKEAEERDIIDCHSSDLKVEKKSGNLDSSDKPGVQADLDSISEALIRQSADLIQQTEVLIQDTDAMMVDRNPGLHNRMGYRRPDLDSDSDKASSTSISTSSSEDEDMGSSDSLCLRKKIQKPICHDDDDDDEKTGRRSTTQSLPKTKGEISIEDLPPLEELTITVGDDVNMVQVGHISTIVETLVIVQANRDVPALNMDTVLFLEGRKVMGQVFETFGPVAMPLYSVRFNNQEHIQDKKIVPGLPVYYAPDAPEYTHYVFMAHLQSIRGSDASWEHNNEPPPQFIEYSDDDDERKAKKDLEKERRRQREGETTETSATKPKRNRRRPRNDKQEENTKADDPSSVKSVNFKTSVWPPRDFPLQSNRDHSMRTSEPAHRPPWSSSGTGWSSPWSKQDRPPPRQPGPPWRCGSSPGYAPRPGGPGPRGPPPSRGPVPQAGLYGEPPPRPPQGPPLGAHGPPLGAHGPPLGANGPPLRNFGPPGTYGPPTGSHGTMSGPPPGNHGPPLNSYRPASETHGPPQGMHGPSKVMHGPPHGMHGPLQGMHGPPQGPNQPNQNMHRSHQGPHRSHQGLNGPLQDPLGPPQASGSRLPQPNQPAPGPQSSVPPPVGGRFMGPPAHSMFQKGPPPLVHSHPTNSQAPVSMDTTRPPPPFSQSGSGLQSSLWNQPPPPGFTPPTIPSTASRSQNLPMPMFASSNSRPPIDGRYVPSHPLGSGSDSTPYTGSGQFPRQQFGGQPQFPQGPTNPARSRWGP